MAPDPRTGGSSRARDRLPPRRFGGQRGLVLFSIAIAGLMSAYHLQLDLGDLVPSEGGLSIARELFSHALSPALTYESADVPEGTLPLPLRALEAAWVTVRLAAAAISLSVVVGLVLGFAAASVTWRVAPTSGSGSGHFGEALSGPFFYGTARVVIALMRSVHELLWAVLLLAAFGIGQLSVIIAITIPYSGTLAKVFSEMLDEAPRDSALALRAAGASAAQVFLFGLLPRALPDMCAYAFYRFECALRSSAVLGFFGYPTLGYYIAASFENLHYGEIWTYLYTLIALVIVSDAWSGALRRRLVE